MGWLIVLNVVLAFASVVFAVIGALRPGLLSGELSPSKYFAYMYAARAIPFGIALAWVLLSVSQQSDLWLVVASFIQLGDAIVNLRRRMFAPVFFPFLAAAIHAVSVAFV